MEKTQFMVADGEQRTGHGLPIYPKFQKNAEGDGTAWHNIISQSMEFTDTAFPSHESFHEKKNQSIKERDIIRESSWIRQMKCLRI
jgi:hypothetical protein